MLRELLSKSGLSLDRLESFHEVAESGSITAAANGSASRQSLISRQISELEENLGVTLLRRDIRPHQLSKEGEELARLCREFFSGMSDCVNRWQNQQTSVSLASGESLLQWIVLPLIRSRSILSRENLRLALRNMRTTDAIRALAEGKVDLALVRKDSLPSALKSDGEFSIKYRLVLPESLKSMTQRSRGIEVLDDLPLAILEGDGRLTSSIREEAELAGIRLNVRMECSSFTQIAEAIETMNLAGFLPHFAPKIPHTFSVEVAEMNRLNRSLTLAWLPRQAKNRPEIGRVVKALI